MSTLKKLDELLQLIAILQREPFGVTIDRMCEELERPRRTIERLMEVIREQLGDNLQNNILNSDRKKYWSLKENKLNSLIKFSYTDILTLEKLKNRLQNDAEQKILSKIADKIKIINNQKIHKNDIEFLLETQGYAVRQKPLENIDEEILKQISKALLMSSKIKFSYIDSYKNSFNPTVEPYGIKIADCYYLIAKNDEIIKTFKISRIKSIEILDEEYFIPEDFNIQEYCNKSFGVYTGKVENVVIRFAPETADYIKNYMFHPSQTLEVCKEDKSVIVKFQASGTFEIVTELLKWRNSVTILEPQSLIDEYKHTVNLMYKNLNNF